MLLGLGTFDRQIRLIIEVVSVDGIIRKNAVCVRFLGKFLFLTRGKLTGVRVGLDFIEKLPATSVQVSMMC